MSIVNLSRAVFVERHENAVAAGTGTITPADGVDCLGKGGCTFLVSFGTILATAVTGIRVKGSDDDGATDPYVDLAGTGVSVPDTASDLVVGVDIPSPQKRYLKLYIDRVTANAALDGIIALVYDASNLPVIQDSPTVSSFSVVPSPEPGTP